MTKDQILITIRKCARQLKRVPNRDELAKFGLPYKTVRIHFQSSEDAYREAGSSSPDGAAPPTRKCCCPTGHEGRASSAILRRASTTALTGPSTTRIPRWP